MTADKVLELLATLKELPHFFKPIFLPTTIRSLERPDRALRSSKPRPAPAKACVYVSVCARLRLTLRVSVTISVLYSLD